MITEDLLERGLADAANDYDVPAGAVDRLRRQLAPATADDDPAWRRWRPRRPTAHGWMALGAASVVLLIIVAIAVGGHGSRGTEEGGGSSASTAAGAADERNVVHGAIASAGTGAKRARPPVSAPAAVPRTNDQGAFAGSGVPLSGGSGATSAGTSGSVAAPVAPIPTVPDRIIKTGELDLQVAKGQVSSTLNKLTALATLMRGYVQDSRTSEGGLAPSGQVTLRVPVEAFENTITRARAIEGVKVLALETSGKDVTSKYVDIKARLKALQDTRNTFLTLLSKAQTIGETLAVQQHVTDVQTQIEQLQGQLKVLNNQAALSTLTVTVDQKTEVAATKHHEKSGLHKAVDRSVSRFVRGIEAIIGVIGPLLLAALLVALFWVAGKFGYRVLRRRMV